MVAPPKFAIPLADLQKKQKEIVNKVGYKSGIGEYNDPADKDYHRAYKEDPLLNPPPESTPVQERLVREVKKIIAQIPGAVLIGKPTGVKTEKSTLGKLERDYSGEDWGKFKDLNRCTVVVLKARDMSDAWIRVKTHFTGRELRSGFLFHQEKIAEAHSDPCGYSGYTVFVRSIDGEKAEIQINYPPIMYAKSVEEFRATLAERENEMKATFPTLPGGLGHKLYDLHKDNKGTPFGDALEAASRLYYDYFRSAPTDLSLGLQAFEAVRNLKQEAINVLLSPAPVVGLPPKAPPSWMAESRRVWTQRRS